jgi:hypothetical protein
LAAVDHKSLAGSVTPLTPIFLLAGLNRLCMAVKLGVGTFDWLENLV